jgi:hypothetical protein
MKRQVLKFSQFLRESDGIDDLFPTTGDSEGSFECIFKGPLSGCPMLTGEEEAGEIGEALESVYDGGIKASDLFNYVRWAIAQFRNGITVQQYKRAIGEGHSWKDALATASGAIFKVKDKMDRLEPLSQSEERIANSGYVETLDRLMKEMTQVKREERNMRRSSDSMRPGRQTRMDDNPDFLGI